ncbi:MAG: c-type cytochrome [Planctomycetota bacterium]
MADRGDTHYFTPTLNKWFLFSSLAFLVASLWMMVADWNRPWKDYQREFRARDLEKTRATLDALETPAAKQGEAALKAAVEAARSDLAARQGELEKAKAEEFAVNGELYVKDQEAKFAKADYDWTRYLVEEHRREIGDLTAEQEKLDKASDAVATTALAKEEIEAKYKDAKAKTQAIMNRVSEAEKALAAGTRDQERLRKRVEQLAPTDKAVVLADALRDAPGLDFIGPLLQVQKIVLEKLTFELNFTKTIRVDMCTSCHMASDREGWDEAADKEPLRSHPRLDLYLSSSSPHPMKDVGCTICHRGAGEALDFVRADHRASNAEEGERWYDEYHWHKQHHWDYPMLSDAFVEASCVQCHKTSMELIAEEAPKVSEGYQLFEKYGCYACHKVDWFPTTRKPAPSLKGIRAKVRPDWIAAWVANPKAFRPTTWMPQVFHLENYAPDEVISKSNYGQGPEILGQSWNDTSVAAVTAFVLSRSPEASMPPVPVEGNAERGREVFRVAGCLACHNVAPYPGTEAKTEDLAFEKEDTNEHGPNLRGIASKVNREWLYAWIKDPKSYWPDTRMPNLRLSDQDASDVAAYIVDDPDAFFHEVPAGWVEKPSPVDAETLREQARWFFNKLGRNELERRLKGENPEHRWDDLEKLEVVVGEQIVLNQGCFSCHEIKGMENEMPIGTELSNWGSKTVDKLDFGFAAYKDLGGRPMLDHSYREGWLQRKLHAPRSFDLEKIKNPKEKLRMPYFAFTEEQADSIATFVVGLVDDEVQRAKMVPTTEEQSMDAGLRAMRQKNCAACHVLEPGEVTFRDADGVEHTVSAELTPLESAKMPPPMTDLAALEAWIKNYEEENEEEVEEIGLRLLAAAPDVGLPGENVSVERKNLIAVSPPNGGRFVDVVTDYYFYGAPRFDPEATDPEEAVSYLTADPDGEGKVEDVDGVFRNYSEEPYDKVRWTYAPPVLVDEGGKLQRNWFFGFLNDPVPLRQQIRVRMPTFHYDGDEAGAIADYFANASARDWPSRYARTMRLALGMKLKEGHQDDAERVWPQVSLLREQSGTLPLDEVARGAGLDPKVVLGIERGSAADITGGFAKLRAFGESRGFRMAGPVDPAYESVHRRAPTHLEARSRELAGHGGPISLGQKVGLQGPNCYQCHWHEGVPPDQKDSPLSWGPDLFLTHERLREAWVEDWLWNPGLVYPGTSMPGNFQGDPPQYQNVYPDSSNEQQIQSVLDWLFNMDRAAPMSQ